MTFPYFSTEIQIISNCYLEGFLAGNKKQAVVVGFAVVSIQNFAGFMWSKSRAISHECHLVFPFLQVFWEPNKKGGQVNMLNRISNPG